ncbi:LLM class flavin-dependent oxidoreductase [Streptomyces justiciae]|uniref:LLM class flavin-dependent oxidoreductase n=1 Tax=Streptomyces justiciae TaxID=2780140 RepID=UPI002118CC49|nr:LLM class flavin-dependent oxidoreductase [Streptomyces justiciae]MCW8378715.1 LLM class flavin-dependent oxidoreductase [Streptomyces justiciae]
MTIKAWVFSFNAIHGPDMPDFFDEDLVQQTFDANLDRIARFEEAGFEGVFFSEHHFIASLTPSPHLLIAAAASRTKTLKLGVMGTVLAFHQPWRVAEELGMLDYITRGRLEIGVASGVPPEFLFVNVPQEDVRPMYRESLEFLDKALESRAVTHEGRFWNFDEVPIMPALKKADRRRKWMTVYSADSCRVAAQRGYKICTSLQSVENAKKAYDAYREEADKIGYEVTPDDLGIRRSITLGATDAEAQELFERTMPLQMARMAATFEPVNERLQRSLGHGASPDVLKSGLVDGAAPRREGAEHLPDAEKVSNANPDALGMVSEDEVIIGSPETAAEKIIDQCRRLGAGHIVGGADMAFPLTEAELDTQYDLWEQMIPILRKANVVD